MMIWLKKENVSSAYLTSKVLVSLQTAGSENQTQGNQHSSLPIDQDKDTTTRDSEDRSHLWNTLQMQTSVHWWDMENPHWQDEGT